MADIEFGRFGAEYELWDADHDTGIEVERTADDDTIRFHLGGGSPITNFATINQTNGFVVNEQGDDVDFRIEGSTQEYLFNIDAGNDGVGIGGEWMTYDREEGGPVTQTPKLLITREDTTDSPPLVGLSASNGSARAFTMTYLRARGSADNFEIVEDGDVIGEYFFEAFDGDAFIRGGVISCEIQGSTGTQEMPMAVVFKNTETVDPIEVGRIGPTGDWTFGGPYTNPVHTLSQSGDATFNQRNSQLGDVTIKGQNTNDVFFTDASKDAAAFGTTDVDAVIGGTTYRNKTSVNTSGNTDNNSILLRRRTSNQDRPPRIVGLRARGAGSSDAAVRANDPLLEIVGAGFDGTDYAIGAKIRFESDSPSADYSAGDAPGRIVFLTSPDGSETPTEALRIDRNQSTIASGRIQGAKGSSVASSSLVTLGYGGNLFHITGTTTIDYIDGTDWQDGSEVTLVFDSTPTVNHATSPLNASTKPIFFKSRANTAMAANDTLTIKKSGSYWYEI